MPKQRCIIVDIDGTIANHDGIRKHHAYNQVHLDEPHADIIELIHTLWYMTHSSVDFIVVSGRPDSCRDDTITWLNKHRLPWSRLFMRRAGDYRKDYIVKAELYDECIKPFYDVWFALDDRDQIVKMWREKGIRCLQVKDGNY